MISTFDENGATIHFSPDELHDIALLTGAMSNPNSTIFKTQIFIDIFNEIFDHDKPDSIQYIGSKEIIAAVFNTKPETPSKEERARV